MSTFRNAGTAVGSWVSIGDGVSAELMGRAGFDFLILDAQHGGIDWHNLSDTLRAVELGGTQALVRVPWCTADYIMRVIDLGAAGVIVPMVSTAEEARIAAQACRYPPQGNRSFGKVRSYYTPAGDAIEPLCFVMIETAEAMENLDAIAATPGVDGLFVGPFDLALSLGLDASLGKPPAVSQEVKKVVAACSRQNVIPAIAAFGTDHARELAGMGMSFIAVGSDSGFVRSGAAGVLEAMKDRRKV